MTKKYKDSAEVPTEILCKRIDELSDAVTHGRESLLREYYMSIPARLDHDADLVLSEASNRLKKTIWQDIKTAPMDGTEILGFCDFHGVFVMFYYADVGWKGAVKPEWDILEGYEKPTHWMPLPKGLN